MFKLRAVTICERGGRWPPSCACFEAVFFVRILHQFKMASVKGNRRYRVISGGCVRAADWPKRAHPRAPRSYWSGARRRALDRSRVSLRLFISGFIAPLSTFVQPLASRRLIRCSFRCPDGWKRLSSQRYYASSGCAMRDGRRLGLSYSRSCRLLVCLDILPDRVPSCKLARLASTLRPPTPRVLAQIVQAPFPSRLKKVASAQRAPENVRSAGPSKC